MKRILIIDDVHEILIKGLKHAGFEVIYKPDSSRDDLLNDIGDVEGLVVRTKTEIDAGVLAKSQKLKFIARAGSGLDNIDTNYCDEKGIIYFNGGEANADAVGEQTIGMILGMLANMNKADKEVRALIWDREGNRGVELKGKTIGIIGYGNTGKAVAEKLSGFGVHVLAFDKYLSSYSDAYAKEATMHEIFSSTDIITFHIPLTKETKAMVNDEYLKKFSKNIFLLNLSRGKILVTQKLVEAMKSGKVIGCALDVLENEKLHSMSVDEKEAFDYLKNSDRTILTPHIGGWTRESYVKISEVLLNKIIELYN